MSDDPLLRELRSGGEPDSHGRFEVDAEAARRAWRHTFADPRMYVLPFVASAALAGARRIRVTTRRDGLTLHHDGHELDLAGLVQPPFQAQRTPASRMALAWHTALTLNPLHAELRSGTQRLTATELQPADPLPGVQLTLKERRPWTLLPQEPPELRYLRERTWFPLEGHTPRGWDKASAWTLGHSPRHRLTRPPLPSTWASREIQDSPFAFVLALDAQVPWPDGIAFVLDGVLFVQRDVDLGVPRATALVAADGIACDLSWSGPVEGRATEAVQDLLRAQAKDLQDRLAQHTLPGAATQSVLQRLHHHARRTGDLPRLHLVLTELQRRRDPDAQRLRASAQLKSFLPAEAIATLQDRQREPEIAADLLFAWLELDPGADPTDVAASLLQREMSAQTRAALSLLTPTPRADDTSPTFARIAVARTLQELDQAHPGTRDERASAADHATVLLLQQGRDARRQAEEALERDRALHGFPHPETYGSAIALALAHPAEAPNVLPRTPEGLLCAAVLAARQGDWHSAANFGRHAVQALSPYRAMLYGDFQGYAEWRAGRRDPALRFWCAVSDLRRRGAGSPVLPKFRFLRTLKRKPPQLQLTISHRGWFTHEALPVCAWPPLRFPLTLPELDRLPDALREAAEHVPPEEAQALRDRADQLQPAPSTDA